MILLIGTLGALLVLQTSTSAGTRTVIDDLGLEVAVAGDVRRVVSLVPTNSEMACLLDCSRLVGGTRYDQVPAELANRVQRKQMQVVGGGFDASLEAIIRLHPDLILTNGPSQQRFAVPLKRLGYSVLSLWPRDLAGLEKSFLLLAEMLNRREKAHRILAEIRQRFASIEARARGKPRKRVFLQMWPDPLITVGKDSFPDWLVRAAGGINAFGDMPFDSGQVSLEALIERNPDVLIFLAEHEPVAKAVARRPGWSSLRGVRENHFCFIEEPDIRRSVGFLDGLTKIQRCLFPELR